MAKHVRHVTAPFSYHGVETEAIVRVQPSPFLEDAWYVLYGGTVVFIATKAKAIARARDDAKEYGACVEVIPSAGDPASSSPPRRAQPSSRSPTSRTRPAS